MPEKPDSNNCGVALSPLDVEGPPLPLKPGGGGGGGEGSRLPPPRAAAASLDKKIDRHLLPCLCVISVANYLDRTNLAFAAAGLKRDVGITVAQYGLGSSLLFATYCGAQLFVSLLGARFGVTRVLCAACVLWGVTAASMAAISSPGSFFAARLALGLAEAPTYPLIATLLRTFHAQDTAVGAAYSWVHAATLVASVIGGPLAAAVLAMEGLGGLAGWRWLFIVEGILPIVAGVWVAFLPASPAEAKFLTPEERERIATDITASRGGHCDGAKKAAAAAASSSGENYRIEKEDVVAAASRGDGGGGAAEPLDARSLWEALKHTLLNWRLIVAATIEGVFGGGKWAAQFFTPILVEEIIKPPGKNGGKSARYVAYAALLSAVPFFFAAATSVLNGWGAKRAARSARGWGRRAFLVWPALLCAAGLFAVGPLLDVSPPSPATRALAFVAVVAALQGFAGWGVAMSLPSTLAGGGGRSAHGATAYAAFVAVGTLGGLWGPALMGELTAKTGGSYTVAGATLGGVALAMGLVWAVAFGLIVPGGK